MPLTTAGSLEWIKAYLGESNTKMDQSNTQVGVGNSTTAFSKAQTDLQGVTKLWKNVDSGYPQRASNVVTLQATFGPSEAQFTWAEHGVRVGGTGLHSRKVESLGDKSLVSQTWIFVLSCTVDS